jgi:uncharacterized protein
MNTWIGKLIITIGIVFAALGLYNRFGPGIPVQSVVTQKQDLFTVSGEGKVTVVPDTAIANLGVNINRPTVQAAQDEANTIINNITQATRNLGIEPKDIQTSNYSVYPQYDFRDGSMGRITGYQVNVTLNITVRDMDRLNQVVDAATSNGANTVGGIQLTVDEDKQKELMQEARELAVNEAKEKAENLARAAGITLGKIVNVVESPTFKNGPMPLDLRNAESGFGGAGSPDIQPGSTDITTSVTLYYETR